MLFLHVEYMIVLHVEYMIVLHVEYMIVLHVVLGGVIYNVYSAVMTVSLVTCMKYNFYVRQIILRVIFITLTHIMLSTLSNIIHVGVSRWSYEPKWISYVVGMTHVYQPNMQHWLQIDIYFLFDMYFPFSSLLFIIPGCRPIYGPCIICCETSKADVTHILRISYNNGNQLSDTFW